MRRRRPPPAKDFVLCDAWASLGPPEKMNLANNCYSYSVANLDSILDFDSRAHAQATPQPGDRSGVPKNILLLLHHRSLQFWVKLAQRDGLRLLPVGKDDPLPDLPAGERLVTLTYNPKYKDYHWMRREKNGMWTHKPDSSGRPPSWFDHNRQLITDPRRADLYYEYPDFVFFALPEEGIDVRMSKPWLKFFNSLDDATYGNYKALRSRLHDLAGLVRADYAVLADYLADLAEHGDEIELRKFWKHLREGTRLAGADGLLPVDQAHAPLGIAWRSLTR